MRRVSFAMVVIAFALVALATSSVARSATQDEGEGQLKEIEIQGVIDAYQLDPTLVKIYGDEEPGKDPDAKTVWLRDGKPFRIEKFERRYAIYRDEPEGWVKPVRGVNVSMEIYTQDEKWIWVWFPVSKPKKESSTDPTKYRTRNMTKKQVAWLEKLKDDFRLVDLKPSGKKIAFEESSAGLPTSGSWRNYAAIADMNEDGHLDIVAPPQRGGMASLYPSIYLGDGKGKWSQWRGIKWPRGLNYGSTAVADFNKDGHKDIAFGVHLTGIAVFLGDGKGGFTDSSRNLPTDFPVRKVIVVDIDNDGWPDLAGISEGPSLYQQKQEVNMPRLRVFLNRDQGKSWQYGSIIHSSRKIGGDYLAAGDLNADGVPDFVGSSIFYNRPDVIHLSGGDAGTWTTVGSDHLPGFSYYLAQAVGRFASKDRDDAILSFSRHWYPMINPDEVTWPENVDVGGLERFTWREGNVVREPIVAWSGQHAVWAMGSGDFDADGNLDIVYVKSIGSTQGELTILLGDGKGGFLRAETEGIALPNNRPYGVTVADVNEDSRLDLMLMFEDSESTLSSRNGSIRVYLNRGVVSRRGAN